MSRGNGLGARLQLRACRPLDSHQAAGIGKLGICGTSPTKVMPIRKLAMRHIVRCPRPRHIALTGEPGIPLPGNPDGVSSELCFPPSKRKDTEPSPAHGLKGDGFTAVLQHLVPEADRESGCVTHGDGDLFQSERSRRCITDCEGLKLDGWR